MFQPDIFPSQPGLPLTLHRFPGSSLAIEHWRSDELIRLETAILFNDVPWSSELMGMVNAVWFGWEWGDILTVKYPLFPRSL